MSRMREIFPCRWKIQFILGPCMKSKATSNVNLLIFPFPIFIRHRSIFLQNYRSKVTINAQIALVLAFDSFALQIHIPDLDQTLNHGGIEIITGSLGAICFFLVLACKTSHLHDVLKKYTK